MGGALLLVTTIPSFGTFERSIRERVSEAYDPSSGLCQNRQLLFVSRRSKAAIDCGNGHTYQRANLSRDIGVHSPGSASQQCSRAMPPLCWDELNCWHTCAMACLRSRRSEGGGLTLAADTRHFRLLPCRLAASATKGDNAMK